MIETVKQKITESQVAIETTVKSGAGLSGAFAAMTINDWIGAIVGILTAIYMVLQIESAIRKRRDNENRAKNK